MHKTIPCNYVPVEVFCRRVNRVLRFSHLFAILVGFPLILACIFNYFYQIPLYLWINIVLTFLVVLIITLVLIPAKVEITSDGHLIVHAVFLRRADYGRIISITRVVQVPKLFCPVGNRGFYGYWAWCDSPEGFIIFISERKCNYLYKIKTDKNYTIYICTSKELMVY
jgi:membrane-associated HD superfamily phosphohydrolase